MAVGNDLITAVADVLQRTDLDTAGSNVATTKRAVNAAFRDLFNRYAFTWRIVDPPLSVDCVAGTTLYDTSAAAYGSIKLQDIYFCYLDTGDLQSRPLEEWPLWRFRRQYANLAYLPNGKPTIFTRVDQYKIQVALAPESSSYDLKVYYSLEFADITDFTATITQVPQRALEVVQLMMEARLKRWEFTSASPDAGPNVAAAYALAEKAIADLIKEDKAAPNLSFVMQGANIGAKPLDMNYWASPFVTGV